MDTPPIEAVPAVPVAPPVAAPVAASVAPSPIAPQIFAGIGLGFLIGIIAGLSVSPVVQTILGAMVAVVTAFLSWQRPATDAGSAVPSGSGYEWRIGCFGIACVVGIMAGLFLRSNEPFVSVDARVKKWTAAGYSESEARRFVAIQFGTAPTAREGEGMGMGGERDRLPTGRPANPGMSGNLFAQGQAADICAELSKKFGTVDDRLDAFGHQNSKSLTQLADVIRKQALPDRQDLTDAAVKTVCELSENTK